MIEPTPDSLGSGLVLEDRLPLRWHVSATPDDSPHQQLSNEETLRVILSLDEHHVEASDENPEFAHEVQRLETKINLILELVSQVLARQLQLPEALAVRLSAHEIEWEAATAPVIGSAVLVEAYVCPRYPRPLILPATVQGFAGGRVRAVFDDLGESVQELLEKLIFRHHRRQIAATRRGGV
ncbi:MAG TPA: PilZ domain-containing protein [Acidiferrobacterales bacterium]|nr:PilZ domain-containing protein [Acidiferrobacterales bacterium]